MHSVDDPALLVTTRFLLQQMERAVGVPYAQERWAPVGDQLVEMAARRMGTVLVDCDLPEGVYEMATPGYFGHAVIAIRKGLTTNERRLAIRHGLAHLLAGELDSCEGGQVRFMSSMVDVMSLEERRADLFALADMVPDWWLEEVATKGEGELEVWAAEWIRMLIPSWPGQRVQDRARLRVRLFRGIP
jgi:hypothetical protein